MFCSGRRMVPRQKLPGYEDGRLWLSTLSLGISGLRGVELLRGARGRNAGREPVPIQIEGGPEEK